MHSEYDLAIVGSGLVGSSLALALSGSGLRILQLESQALSSSTANFDERHLALNAHTLQRLTSFGVQGIASEGAAIEQIHISRHGEFGRVKLSAQQYGLSELGRVVPARILSRALEQALPKVPELTRLRPARLHGLQTDASGVTLEVSHADNDLSLRARMVVGADGTASSVRKFAEIGADIPAYEHQALVFNLRTERSSNGCAYERFTATGPIALLPLPERRMGAVWTLPLVEADRMMGLSEPDFLQRFQSAFGYRLGRFTKLGSRTLWPLSYLRAHASGDPRVVLIGNAAQTIHPLGAQGFNLGLRDAEVLAAAIRSGNLDSPTLVEDYQAARARDREQTYAFSDATLLASSSDNLLAKLGRTVGFALLDRLPPAKLELLRWGLGHTRSAA